MECSSRKFILCPLLLSLSCLFAFSLKVLLRDGSETVHVLSGTDRLHLGTMTNYSTVSQAKRYLSYQPPGNGWNNQRIALEGAMLMSILLNRTLIVHPLASHTIAMETKRNQLLSMGERRGYIAYNKMQRFNLLPLSLFLDLDLISRVVPVMEFNGTHKEFISAFSNLRWHRVCHSVGFGYWADRRPMDEREKVIWRKQVFAPLPYYQDKCPIEIEEAKHSRQPIVKFISDLKEDDSELLYIEEGTVFGIQFRFISLEDTLTAQNWVVKHIRYNKGVYSRAEEVRTRLGSRYNSIHIRRVDHAGAELTWHDWFVRIMDADFTTDLPIYVATDEPNLSWFNPIRKAGFQLYFAQDFPDVLNFSFIHKSVRQDYLGIHEQVICELSDKFVPTGHSTFSHYVQRIRGEVDSRDGLYMETVHSFWIGHTVG